MGKFIKGDIVIIPFPFTDLSGSKKRPAFLLSVLGDIARSKGMAQIARELNLARESLYRSLSQDGNPSFSTVAKVLDNLGFQLSVSRKSRHRKNLIHNRFNHGCMRVSAQSRRLPDSVRNMPGL